MDDGKIRLTKIDDERWRFTLYETENKDWIADFNYSPISFVDSSMLIVLTSEEKMKTQLDRQFLIDFSDKLRNNFNSFLSRAESRDDFIF